MKKTTKAMKSSAAISTEGVAPFKIPIPKVYLPLFGADIDTYKYIVIHSGRWAGKTWQVALSLVLRMIKKPMSIVCAREYQNRLEDTVYARIVSTINDLNYSQYFTPIPTKSKIKCVNGGEFVFRGLRDEGALNSIDNISILWIDEAQFITEKSLEYATPSVRGKRQLGRRPKMNSTQFIFTLNPRLATDPVYDQFVMGKIPAKHLRFQTNWRNMVALDMAMGVVDEAGRPAFAGEFERQRALLNNNTAAYRHIWEGDTTTAGTAILASIRKTDLTPSEGGILFIDPAYGGDDSTALTFANHRGDLTIACGFLLKGGDEGGSWGDYLDRGIFHSLIDEFAPRGVYIETANAKNDDASRVLRRAGINAAGWYSTVPKKKRIGILSTHTKFVQLSEITSKDSPMIAEANAAYNEEVLSYTEKAPHDDAPDSLASAMAALHDILLENEHK